MQDTFAEIEALATGDYAPFAGHLVGPGDCRPAVSAGELLNADIQQAIHRRFSERFTRFDRRATLSIWVKWHLNAVLPPLLMADVLLARRLPVALDDATFIIADDARTAAMKCRHGGVACDDPDPFIRFDDLIFRHFAPLVALMTARTGLTQRVLWSNIGNTFEAMLRRIEKVSGCSERLATADQMLATPRWPDGRPNPLYGAVHYVEGDGCRERRRKVCCLQYRLPDRRFCSACPIEDAREASVAH
jgi:ferric iron reductase protein FhuF